MRLLSTLNPSAHLRGTLAALLLLLSLLSAEVLACAADEYVGKLDPQLIADDDDLEQVIFKPFRDLSKTKLPKAIESNATVSAGRLFHALSDKSAIYTLLVDRKVRSRFFTPMLISAIRSRRASASNWRALRMTIRTCGRLR